MTMEVSGKSGYAQQMFDKIDRDYKEKIPHFEAYREQFAIARSYLEFQICTFKHSNMLNTPAPTNQQFVALIEKLQKIGEIYLRKINETKKLQQECNSAKIYLKPSLSVETLEGIKEQHPDFYKQSLEDAGTCRNYFTKLNEYEDNLFCHVKYMELQYREFEHSIKRFQAIADNTGILPELPKIETKAEQSELSFEQQIANAEALATTDEKLGVQPEITTSTADEQKIKTGNNYRKKVSPVKWIARIIHSLCDFKDFNDRRKK